MASRMAACVTAKTLGYFWLPCPVCGEEFGGQEWRKIDGHEDSIPASGADQSDAVQHGAGICPTCTAAGEGCKAWAAAGLLYLHANCPAVAATEETSQHD